VTGRDVGHPGPPVRVRVTSPRSTAARPRRMSPSSEIDAQTRVGELYMRSLMRTQLRLAATVLLLLALTVGGLPLLFAFVPAVTDAHLLGVPLPWALLGFAVYPCLVGLGWLYVRQAERNEAAFAELVEPREALEQPGPEQPGLEHPALEQPPSERP
jgi:hypothetical protein